MERLSYINTPHDATPTESELDALFSALADPTRRAILRHLTKHPASVGELAAPFDMSQPAISKHLKVLEGAGLITREQQKQKRLANLNAVPMRTAVNWLEDFAGFWEGNLDALDSLLEDLKTQQDDEPLQGKDTHK